MIGAIVASDASPFARSDGRAPNSRARKIRFGIVAGTLQLSLLRRAERRLTRSSAGCGNDGCINMSAMSSSDRSKFCVIVVKRSGKTTLPSATTPPRADRRSSTSCLRAACRRSATNSPSLPTGSSSESTPTTARTATSGSAWFSTITTRMPFGSVRVCAFGNAYGAGAAAWAASCDRALARRRAATERGECRCREYRATSARVSWRGLRRRRRDVRVRRVGLADQLQLARRHHAHHHAAAGDTSPLAGRRPASARSLVHLLRVCDRIVAHSFSLRERVHARGALCSFMTASTAFDRLNASSSCAETASCRTTPTCCRRAARWRLSEAPGCGVDLDLKQAALLVVEIAATTRVASLRS